ncbi:hypothetical protein [Salibacterium aidingense]|uniref:hypothetical protein n=1 Tax=Salibacterium aidingense TaxID=384933 RepID=UPI003BEDBC03
MPISDREAKRLNYSNPAANAAKLGDEIQSIAGKADQSDFENINEIADPASATSEDNANKINEILSALKGDG